jgi:hypothetical protein
MTVKKEESSEEMVQIPKAELDGIKTQLEEMTKFRSDTEDYLKGATVVVNTLASDANLTKAFRAKLSGVVEPGEGTGEQPKQEPKKEDPPADDGTKTKQYNEGLEEVKSSQREQIVTAFEKDYGIAGLPEEDRNAARRKVEGFLNDFGWGVKTMPLTQLRSSMEKAYLATHAEKLREEGKLEGFVQAKTNEAGIMGSFPAGTAEKVGQETELTPKQKEWNKKLGVDDEGAKKIYLDKDNEETRKSTAEVKAEEAKKSQ